MDINGFIKKYQGKYYFYSNDVSVEYAYLKKIKEAREIEEETYFYCIFDVLHIPIEGEPTYLENDNVFIMEKFMLKQTRISKSEFNKMIKEYGIRGVQEKVPG